MQWIRTLVDRAVRSLHVNRLAIQILDAAHVPEYDTRAAAKAIYNWVRTNFRFVPDPIGYDENWQPTGYETLRPVEELLQVRAGDCDDINSILLASLLSSVGIVVRLVTVASDPDQPGLFSHIYFEALIDGEWVAVDAARPGAKFGREPEYWTAKRIWGLDGGYVDIGTADTEGATMNGLRGLGQDDGTDDSGIDWGAIATQALSETPQIISAVRAPGSALPALALSQTRVATAATTIPVTTTAANSSLFGLTTTDLVLGVVVIGLFFVMGRR